METVTVKGRRAVVRHDSVGWYIEADETRRGLMLNSRGEWESYLGESKHWPTREEAEAFLRENADKPEEPIVPCPQCGGSGESGLIPLVAKRTPDAGPITAEQAKALADMVAKCSFCDGVGHVAPERLEWRATGERWRQARKDAGYGLREWADRVGCLPADYCDMESGRMKPDERFSPVAPASGPAGEGRELPDSPGLWFRSSDEFAYIEHQSDGMSLSIGAIKEADRSYVSLPTGHAWGVDTLPSGGWHKATPPDVEPTDKPWAYARRTGEQSIWDAVQELAPWCESNDMDWCDEILCGLAGVRDRIADLTMMANEAISLRERLTEASRDRDAKATISHPLADLVFRRVKPSLTQEQAVSVATVLLGDMGQYRDREVQIKSRLDGVYGALMDAGNVRVHYGDPGESVRALTAERDILHEQRDDARRDLTVALRWITAAERIGKAAGYEHAELEASPEYFADRVVEIVAGLREQVAQAQRERDAASEALDANWVTHQQLTARDDELRRLRDLLARAKSALPYLGDTPVLCEHPLVAEIVAALGPAPPPRTFTGDAEDAAAELRRVNALQGLTGGSVPVPVPVPAAEQETSE